MLYLHREPRVVDEDDPAWIPLRRQRTLAAPLRATAMPPRQPFHRKKPQNGRVVSLRPEATESGDDNYREDNDGRSPAPLVFIEHEEGNPKKKARVDQAASGDS